ncbi:YbhB/YbcL family Raf kinase inhibitor-like protein [Methanocalculus sp. MSAO_Arc2]|uniref:YbhB/YbcL family Raf kinase inhibitor-like protein n=1 Tax=Methanocalculus sp. MSAO_Arc2 TaxID=2293855 RepID=UPI003217D445
MMEKLTVILGFLEFPPTHTRDGGNISPQIRLLNLKSPYLAVFAYNPYEPGCSFCTWVAWDIPPVDIIPAGFPDDAEIESPIHAKQGRNDYGDIGYRGPAPEPGESHRYLFKVYGLGSVLDVPPGSDPHAVIEAMKGHVLQFGHTQALSQR